MEKTLILGHKNPDTDSICAALVYENFKKQLGMEVVAGRLGEINEETKFILNYVDMIPPKLIESVDENNQLILVDHNEFGQAVDGIEKATILEVIDHHRIDNFKTSGQLFMNVQPVGCTNTILYEIAKQNELVISKEIATLMVSAIISDSLLFKSPTCTDKDVLAANELAAIAEIDLEVYGMEVLKAGTDLSKFSAEEIIGIDAKEFSTTNGKFIVAQVNTASIEDFLNDFEVDVVEAIDKVVYDQGLDLFILLVTDIINSDSLALVRGTTPKVFERAFETKLVDSKALLKGVVSRKKQVVPFL